MLVHLDATDTRPLYVQIMDAVRGALVRGTLGPEDPLPSVRELSASLRVNPRTVSQAYAELERDGVVHVRRGQGTFVSPGVRPAERERPRLAREVARRALAEARRNGLTVEELMGALRAMAESETEAGFEAGEAPRVEGAGAGGNGAGGEGAAGDGASGGKEASP